MAGSSELQHWFDQWNHPDHETWKIIAELATMTGGTEPDLRNILRPHEEDSAEPAEPEERSSKGGDLTRQRSELDKALDALTYIEIGLQLGFPASAAYSHDVAERGRTYPAILPEQVILDLAKLAGSEAFLRYLSVYLFFGIRFFAARDRKLCGAAHEAEMKGDGRPSQVNRPSLRLVPPPDLKCNRPEKLLHVLQRLGGSPTGVGGSTQYAHQTRAVKAALDFLDGFRKKLEPESPKIVSRSHEADQRIHEPRLLELWMRGLLPELEREDAPSHATPPDPCVAVDAHDPTDGDWCRLIERGLKDWATERAELYLLLRDPPDNDTAQTEATIAVRPLEGWRCDTPFTARLALADMYWLAGILGADVTPAGEVTYRGVSWLGLLQYKAALDCDHDGGRKLRHIEEILRQVFCVTCELVQNAAELREQQDHIDAGEESCTNKPPARWRAVFDAEMGTIARQRMLRNYNNPPARAGIRHEEEPKQYLGWSKRLYAEDHERNLIGVCLSGGGIRSATFNLGVLQGLQELDMLRQVDYLSTVSGGGFTGAWLLGNVRRSRYWLGSMAPWEKSIAHLRAYSNYLAPRTGVLSMDTWSLGALWLRNALLIQLTTFVWVLAVFTGVYFARLLFLRAVTEAARMKMGGWMVLPATQLIALLMAGCVVSIVLLSCIMRERRGVKMPGLESLRRWALAPAMLTALYVIWADVKWACQEFRGWADFVQRITLIRFYSALLMSIVAAVMGCAVLVMICWVIWKKHTKRLSRARWIRTLAVIPSWVGSALLAARFFSFTCSHQLACSDQWIDHFKDGNAPNPRSFSTMFVYGVEAWQPVLWCAGMAFLVLSAATLFSADYQRFKAGKEASYWERFAKVWYKWAAGSVLTAFACTVVVQLCLSTFLYAALAVGDVMKGRPAGLQLIAFVAGPAMVLVAFTLGILMLIGLSGKYSNEAQREWWTRFGTWILIFALIGVVVPGIVFGGPWLMSWVATKQSTIHSAVKWGAVVSWLGTVVGGLLAGKSSKTAEDARGKAPWLEILAKAGGFLFLLGLSVASAQVLFVFFKAMLKVVPSGVSAAVAETTWSTLFVTLAVLLACGWLFSWLFEINIFGLNQLYRNRLVRCYLGATRWRPGMRAPEPFTRFDFHDDLDLSAFTPEGNHQFDKTDEFRGPFPILNCSLNLAGSTDLALNTRHSASFSLTPLFCGADRPLVGYAPTKEFANGVRLGQAVSVSGAAASPNMGYNTSPMVAFLLTMFNVRLGWWFPNPGRKKWKARGLSSSLYYLLMELVGEANETRSFLNVSDGGHFENLGIYELVRRNCKVIICGDAECDEVMQFGGLANAIRLCATDFGAVIEMDVSSLRLQPDGQSLLHASIGTIKYSNGSIGRLIYLKASVTGDEDVSIQQYRSAHPSFPHETTADQFFSEDQFESYRRLGQHVVDKSFCGAAAGDRLAGVAEQLADMLTPGFSNSERFLKHSRQLDLLWERLRISFAGPGGFFAELTARMAPQPTPLTEDVIAIGLEMIQFMEDVFIDLRLDDFWEHPDNRGWAMLFTGWARSPRFRQIWKGNHRTFGIRFEYFCRRRLGLYGEKPVMRVSPVIRG